MSTEPNYYDTFIEVAPDCPTQHAETPPRNPDKITVANIEYEIIAGNPYEYTSDDVLFQVFAVRNQISAQDLSEERRKLFSKGQPCLRSSPLGKRYGWGIHSNAEGKVALYAMESDEYGRLAKEENVMQLKAMRSKRA